MSWQADVAFQLEILAIRPTFLKAVKKKVASTWLFTEPGWCIDNEPHSSLSMDNLDRHRERMEGKHLSREDDDREDRLEKCSDAARNNLALGQYLLEVQNIDVAAKRSKICGKLLSKDLHHIFNAATILMLHQIANPNLRTQDVNMIEFAIKVFDKEAATGSDYGKDCAKVLHDFWALVGNLRQQIGELWERNMVQMNRDPMPGEQIYQSLTLAHAAYDTMESSSGATNSNNNNNNNNNNNSSSPDVAMSSPASVASATRPSLDRHTPVPIPDDVMEELRSWLEAETLGPPLEFMS